MEPFGAMLITLPIFLPVLSDFGVSLIWFGVLVVKLLEIGMITPPVGMNIFVIRGVASQYASLVDIFRGVTLFLVRSEEHTSELQSRPHLVCRLLLEKKKKNITSISVTSYNCLLDT